MAARKPGGPSDDDDAEGVPQRLDKWLVVARIKASAERRGSFTVARQLYEEIGGRDGAM